LFPIDLHCHSDRSDGCLTPQALVARAASRGVRVLALTDHDTLDGVGAASAAAQQHGIALVPGVEISASWNGRTLHVLGLNVDPASAALQEGLHGIREGRLRRAELIGQRLAHMGVQDCFRGAMDRAGKAAVVGRAHFARHLVATGVVGDMKTAFRRFLGEGKPGYVRHRWPLLGDALDWIGAAGGAAVLAHPLRYGLRAGRMQALLREFKSLGGAAMEVVTGGQQGEQARQLGRLAAENGLFASAGSDFHETEGWTDLGDLESLPEGCGPVWQEWAIAEDIGPSFCALERCVP
jgi:predicted metal-dependent phosphoesterase TrpH